MPEEHLIELSGFVAFEAGYLFEEDELISLRGVKRAMLNAPEGDIRIRLSSPGGVALAGSAIAAVLYPRRSDITVEILGMAGSAATLIALAGSRLEMTEGSFFMVHKTRGFMFGTDTDMLKEGEILGKLNTEYAQAYVRESNLTMDHVREAMLEETWYTAEEAVEAGFADAATEGSNAETEEAQANMARALAESPWSRYVALQNVPPELFIERRQEAPKVAKAARVPKKLDDPPNDPPTEPQGDPEPQGDADPRAGDDSSILVDAGEWSEMQATIKGLQAANATLTERVERHDTETASQRQESLIQAALRDGRIQPAMATFWREQLKEAEATTTKILAKLPKDPKFTPRGSSTTEIVDDEQGFEETAHGRTAVGEMGWDANTDDDEPDALKPKGKGKDEPNDDPGDDPEAE